MKVIDALEKKKIDLLKGRQLTTNSISCDAKKISN